MKFINNSLATRLIIVVASVIYSNLFLSTETWAQPSLPTATANSPLAAEIARLRGEVESLNNQLQIAREEQRSQVSSYASRKGDLQALIEKDKIALSQIEEKIKRTQESQMSFGNQAKELTPQFMATADAFKVYVQQSLPYSRDDRIAAIEAIQKQVQGGELNAWKAYGRLWSLVEDELRLANEMSLAKQPIILGDKEFLADIAKVGSVMLYFRTAEGQVGYAHRKEGSWQYQTLNDPKAKREVEHLFESLKKQVRVGVFELPAVMPI